MDSIFDNERPIYIQLVQKIELEIISGKLKPGERIASVRELSGLMKVNPNTMQKALSELEDEGLIYTERTNGKYVTTDNKLIERKKRKIAESKIQNYIKDMNKIGITFEEAVRYLQEMGGK